MTNRLTPGVYLVLLTQSFAMQSQSCITVLRVREGANITVEQANVLAAAAYQDGRLVCDGGDGVYFEDLDTFIRITPHDVHAPPEPLPEQFPESMLKALDTHGADTDLWSMYDAKVSEFLSAA